MNIDSDQVMIEAYYQANEGSPYSRQNVKIKRLKFALSEKQRHELLERSMAMNPLHALMIELQMKTGLRAGELVHLRIENVNLTEGCIYITRDVEAGWFPKTPSSFRRIPLDHGMIVKLRGHLSKRRSGYVFQSQRGPRFSVKGYINTVNERAKQCKSIGRAIGSHSLRRTYASYLSKEGLEISAISRYMGHESVRTTLLYLYEIDSLESDERHNEIVGGMV